MVDASAQELIFRDISSFYRRIQQEFHVRKILLYGSYARGLARPDSDIDVGVVMEQPEGMSRVQVTARLSHYATQVNPDLEPRCIFWQDYNHHEPASILGEIIRTAIEVPIQ